MKIRQTLALVSVISVIGTQSSYASYEVHCPSQLDVKEKKDVTDVTVYKYSGKTTGGKELVVKTDTYGPKLKEPYKFLGMGGAATEFFCSYALEDGATRQDLVYRGDDFKVDECKLIKPEGEEMDTNNTYFECP